MLLWLNLYLASTRELATLECSDGHRGHSMGPNDAQTLLGARRARTHTQTHTLSVSLVWKRSTRVVSSELWRTFSCPPSQCLGPYTQFVRLLSMHTSSINPTASAAAAAIDLRAWAPANGWRCFSAQRLSDCE